MTEHYVTIFDSLFLPQGLALHRSMLRHAGDFRLWIVCVDDLAADALTQLALDRVEVIRLTALEDNSLKAIKSQRTKGEYCWTLTPFAPRFVFDADPSVGRVTYLDADMWFMRAPSPIFREFEASSKSVLITEHAYAPEHDQSEISGQYCVQFVTFVKTTGEPVRAWWEERCREWCFARVEVNRFGDQKYLDQWPDLFGNLVHILADKERLLAPWNVTRFPRGNAVAFHFHGLRLIDGHRVKLAKEYGLPKGVWTYIYLPYMKDLTEALGMLRKAGIESRPQSQDSRKMLRRLIEDLQHHRRPPMTRIGRGEVVRLPPA